MCFDVTVEVCLFAGMKRTVWTSKRFLSSVSANMNFEVFFLDGPEWTVRAGKWPFSCVSSNMLLEVCGDAGVIWA